MSDFYELFVFLPAEAESTKVIRQTHETLVKYGGQVTDDNVYILSQPFSSDDQVLVISDINQAIRQLELATGDRSLEYVMPEGSVLVTFHSFPDDSRVDAVELSILDSFLDEDAPQSNLRYTAISEALHSALRGRRTIMDWGLKRKGFEWREEVERIYGGAFEGFYRLADLRQAL